MSRIIGQDFHRPSDGSIDLDCYRVSATALRRRALRDGRTLRIACSGLLSLGGALMVISLIAASPMPATRGLASMAQTHVPQTW